MLFSLGALIGGDLRDDDREDRCGQRVRGPGGCAELGEARSGR